METTCGTLYNERGSLFAWRVHTHTHSACILEWRLDGEKLSAVRSLGSRLSRLLFFFGLLLKKKKKTLDTLSKSSWSPCGCLASTLLSLAQATQSCCLSEWQHCCLPRYTCVKPPTFSATLIEDDRRPACNQAPTNVAKSCLLFPNPEPRPTHSQASSTELVWHGGHYHGYKLSKAVTRVVLKSCLQSKIFNAATLLTSLTR